MKTIDTVLTQLSNLYEFNKQIQTFRLQKAKREDEMPPPKELDGASPQQPPAKS